MTDPVTPSHWEGLRSLTPARIATGRSGISLPTAAHLRFQLDHARARKAVHHPLATPALARRLAGLGLPIITLQSAARDRTTYLQRPDLGRQLSPEAEARLNAWKSGLSDTADSLVLVVADGLSALAVEHNAPALLGHLVELVQAQGLPCGPLVIVEQGRVAIADQIARILGGSQVAILIGERPGLSSADSMGVYFTHAPRPGLTDEARNCISNIRPAGLSTEAAAAQLMWLVTQARRLGLSGVALKPEAGSQPPQLSE